MEGVDIMRIMVIVPKAMYGESIEISEFGVFDVKGNGIIDCILAISDADLETAQLSYQELACKKIVSTEFSPYALSKLDELAIQNAGDDLVDIYDFCGVSELKAYIPPVCFIENAYSTDRKRSDVMKALDTMRECDAISKHDFIRGIITNTIMKLHYAVTNNTITFEAALKQLDDIIVMCNSLIHLGQPIPSQVLEDLKTIYTAPRSQWRTYFATFLLQSIKDFKCR